MNSPHQYPNQDLAVPVIAVDGGAYTGKTTVCDLISLFTGFPHFDSGILYRAIGYQAYRSGIPFHDVCALVHTATTLDIALSGSKIVLNGEDVTVILRTEFIGSFASKVAQISEVRESLLPAQTKLRVLPGLVANGRDMAWVFDTSHMFYIHVDSRERAKRKLLKEKKDPSNEVLLNEAESQILARDHRDQVRDVSPLKRHPGAELIDATLLTPEELAGVVLEKYYGHGAPWHK